MPSEATQSADALPTPSEIVTASGDPYATLGLAETSTLEAIKKRYKKLALAYHPDRQEEASLSEKYTPIFQLIAVAYAILGDQNRRKIYDERKAAERKASKAAADRTALVRQPKQSSASKPSHSRRTSSAQKPQPQTEPSASRQTANNSSKPSKRASASPYISSDTPLFPSANQFATPPPKTAGPFPQTRHPQTPLYKDPAPFSSSSDPSYRPSVRKETSAPNIRSTTKATPVPSHSHHNHTHHGGNSHGNGHTSIPRKTKHKSHEPTSESKEKAAIPKPLAVERSKSEKIPDMMSTGDGVPSPSTLFSTANSQFPKMPSFDNDSGDARSMMDEMMSSIFGKMMKFPDMEAFGSGPSPISAKSSWQNEAFRRSNRDTGDFMLGQRDRKSMTVNNADGNTYVVHTETVSISYTNGVSTPSFSYDHPAEFGTNKNSEGYEPHYSGYKPNETLCDNLQYKSEPICDVPYKSNEPARNVPYKSRSIENVAPLRSGSMSKYPQYDRLPTSANTSIQRPVDDRANQKSSTYRADPRSEHRYSDPYARDFKNGSSSSALPSSSRRLSFYDSRPSLFSQYDDFSSPFPSSPFDLPHMPSPFFPSATSVDDNRRLSPFNSAPRRSIVPSAASRSRPQAPRRDSLLRYATSPPELMRSHEMAMY